MSESKLRVDALTQLLVDSEQIAKQARPLIELFERHQAEARRAVEAVEAVARAMPDPTLLSLDLGALQTIAHQLHRATESAASAASHFSETISAALAPSLKAFEQFMPPQRLSGLDESMVWVAA